MKKNIFLILFFIFTLVACENIFDEVAKKDTEQALFYEAKLKLNARDYSGAIAIMQSLDPVFLARRDVSLVYASAFSGRCGLEFVELVQDLSNMGSATLFLFLMNTFVGGTDEKITDCLAAEARLKDIGNQTQRTSDENILMGFSSLTKVGTIVSRYADLNSDGITDPAFDHCSTAEFPDSAVREVGTGMANAILSIAAVASDISSDALANITNSCNLTSELNVFCTNTDPSVYSALEVSALRQLIGSSDSGIGACPAFLDPACVCP